MLAVYVREEKDYTAKIRYEQGKFYPLFYLNL